MASHNPDQKRPYIEGAGELTDLLTAMPEDDSIALQALYVAFPDVPHRVTYRRLQYLASRGHVLEIHTGFWTKL